MSDEFELVERAVGPDRRTFIKQVVIGAAFAAPVVSSFSVSGIQAVFAQQSDGSTTATANCNQTTSYGPALAPAAGVPLDVTITGGGVTFRFTAAADALPPDTPIYVDAIPTAPECLDLYGITPPPGSTVINGWSVSFRGLESPASPITLTVHDPAVAADDQVWKFTFTTGEVDTSAVTQALVATATAGAWSVVPLDQFSIYLVVRFPAAPAPAPVEAPITFTG